MIGEGRSIFVEKKNLIYRERGYFINTLHELFTCVCHQIIPPTTTFSYGQAYIEIEIKARHDIDSLMLNPQPLTVSHQCN
mgnify:CR=1 FL=1